MLFTDVVDRLESGFRAELPGAAAQSHLAPRPRRQWPAGSDPEHVRHAAGLLLSFPIDGEAHIILTVRADTLGRHGGQVSLPGGVIDAGETVEQAALREAHEEVALPPDAVRVLGRLTPLDIPVSGFRLHPVVAVADAPQTLTPSDREVARILIVAIDALKDPAAFVARDAERDGVRFVIPGFHVAGVEIWGATAMVLAEFLVLLGWDGP